MLAEGIDDAVNLLRLARQPERLQEQADGRVKLQVPGFESRGVAVQKHTQTVSDERMKWRRTAAFKSKLRLVHMT